MHLRTISVSYEISIQVPVFGMITDIVALYLQICRVKTFRFDQCVVSVRWS